MSRCCPGTRQQCINQHDGWSTHLETMNLSRLIWPAAARSHGRRRYVTMDERHRCVPFQSALGVNLQVCTSITNRRRCAGSNSSDTYRSYCVEGRPSLGCKGQVLAAKSTQRCPTDLVSHEKPRNHQQISRPLSLLWPHYLSCRARIPAWPCIQRLQRTLSL